MKKDSIEKARVFLAELDSNHEKEKKVSQDALNRALDDWRRETADAVVNAKKRSEIIILISKIKNHPAYENMSDDSERMIMELQHDLDNIRIVQYDSAVDFLEKTGQEKLVPVYRERISELISSLVNEGIKMLGNLTPTSLKQEDDILLIKKDRKWGFINTNGETIIPFEYDFAYSFSDGLTCVEKDGKWGFINTNGETIIPFEYDDAYSFSDGLARVKKDGKYGFINTNGKTIIPFEYDDN